MLFTSGPAGAQRTASEPHALSPAPVPVNVRWPSTTAIAVFQPRYPVIVEATSDGWVVLTPVGYGVAAESIDGRPSTHLQLSASWVRGWVRVVRQTLALSRDSTVQRPRPLGLPELGRGPARIYGGSAERGTQLSVVYGRCDGVRETLLRLSSQEVEQFLGALERAAHVAEQGSPRPIPPTLDRPYYASELNCPAVPKVENGPARFPSGVPASQRRYAEVGVRFIVDTSGRIEPSSIAVLPGAPAALERAARDLVAGWRYRPALRAGMPVRQVVATSIVYDPSWAELPPLPPGTASPYRLPAYDVNDLFGHLNIGRSQTSIATSDGWVRVRLGNWNRLGAFTGAQEWFTPDAVDAWAARVGAYVTTDSQRVRRPRSTTAWRAAALEYAGTGYQVRYMTGEGKDSSSWAPWTQMRACEYTIMRGEPFDTSMIERFRAAARAARGERATPRKPADGVFQRGEVACPARLPMVRVLRKELNVWWPPRAPMSRAMESENVRAEVLTSFVVDAKGIPQPSTLTAMPGSDPRAVAALRAALRQFRFQPAMRSGVPVSALVMHRWSFEPHPKCRDTSDGVECARENGRVAPE
jgi:TonB family protein